MLSSVFLYTATTATTTTTTPILILPLPITTAFIKLPPLFPPLPHPKRWFLFFFSPDSPFSLSLSLFPRQKRLVCFLVLFLLCSCLLASYSFSLSLSLSLSLSYSYSLTLSLTLQVAGRSPFRLSYLPCLIYHPILASPRLPPSYLTIYALHVVFIVSPDFTLYLSVLLDILNSYFFFSGFEGLFRSATALSSSPFQKKK